MFPLLLQPIISNQMRLRGLRGAWFSHLLRHPARRRSGSNLPFKATPPHGAPPMCRDSMSVCLWSVCRTPLHAAVASANVSAVPLLLTSGADINCVDVRGRNVVIYVALYHRRHHRTITQLTSPFYCVLSRTCVSHDLLSAPAKSPNGLLIGLIRVARDPTHGPPMVDLKWQNIQVCFL